MAVKSSIEGTSRRYSHEEWMAEAKRRFGESFMQWKFVCPVCGHVQSVQDYKDAGAEEGMIAYSCIGRLIPGSKDAFQENAKGPCTYAGGGLFRLNPVTVVRGGEEHYVFDFA